MNLDNSSSIVLDTDNTHLFNSSRRLIFSSNFWHEFRISNCNGIPRNVVLKAILDAAYPFNLQPLNFNVQNENYHFLSSNCGCAIEKLCQQRLIVNNPTDDQNPFRVTIALSYARIYDLEINVQGNLSQVWRKRYNGVTKTLDLNEFHEDSDLLQYCPLSQTRILDYMLQLGRNFVVQHLKLSNNDIRRFKYVKSYNNCQLHSLDLKNNLITSLDELKLFSSSTVRSVWLEGNPVCDEYDEFSYVCAIKEIFPKVEKLDGVLIYEYGLPTFRSNYVCDVEGRELVDQFLEHYFTLYDSDNRSLLSEFYHADAVFSCTCRYIEGQLSSSSANLARYKKYARNIRTLYFARSDGKLYKGKRSIINALCDLPTTEHDPNTFCVDLTYYTEHSAVITVTGVFREPEVNLEFKQPVLGFSRTFVLTSSGGDEYKIINDQLHVSNATTAQQIRAFKVERTPDVSKLHKPATDAERNDVIQAFGSITTLNSESSKMFLEECNFSLKDALLLFVNLCKVDAIPVEAFIRSNEAVINSNVTTENSNQTSCQIETTENSYKFSSKSEKLPVGYQQRTSQKSERTPNLITVNDDDSQCKRTEEEDFQEKPPVPRLSVTSQDTTPRNGSASTISSPVNENNTEAPGPSKKQRKRERRYWGRICLVETSEGKVAMTRREAQARGLRNFVRSQGSTPRNESASTIVPPVNDNNTEAPRPAKRQRKGKRRYWGRICFVQTSEGRVPMTRREAQARGLRNYLPS